MASSRQEMADRVNVLLPMPTPGGWGRATLLSGAVASEWEAAEYAASRAAAAELEQQEPSAEPAGVASEAHV